MPEVSMKILKHGLLALLGAAPLNYATSCAVVGDSVDGYVTNASSNTYQVTGPVRFVFSSPADMGRPSVTDNANALIPAGRTERVAHAKLAFTPEPGDACSFELGETVRKP
jgi:hypothetical protein